MKATDNNGKKYNVLQKGNLFTLKCEDISEKAKFVNLIDKDFFAKTGDEGYYVIADADKRGSRLCYFNNKSDGERIFHQGLMPIFGIKKDNMCRLCIVSGLASEFEIVFGVKDGQYYIYPRFNFKHGQPYEDIKIEYIDLNCEYGYSEMAVAYRNYQIKNGNCITLKDRINNNPTLDYALNAPEIRIRMGWKPAPPTILEQTAENEPEMHIACTFDRVKDLIDELKNQGVDKAEICLVGWNKSGHDGRYPQLFPVEEKLGGEEKLRDLIIYAKENGYQIICHTNSTDSYSIADCFSEDIVAKKQNGSMYIDQHKWSGGQMYNLCPEKSLEFAESNLPKVQQLGFEGLNYIDVMTVVPLQWCHDEKHPTNPKQTLEKYTKIMELSHKLFGGFSSEGCFDFAAKYLDFGLYVSWPPIKDYMLDEEIPLWQIVYHGIILSNPTTDTVNYPIKAKQNELLLKECGGRPTFYFYSKFLPSFVK